MLRQNMEKTPRHKVIVSDRAHQMLAARIRFLAQKSPSAARTAKDELVNAIRSLREVPERFPFVDVQFVPVNKYHKMCVGKWYLILYQIKDQTAYVDYIVDCRQDCGWLVR